MFPSFADFYAAANDGRSPFPWQERLAAQVAEAGWPSEIGVPTGLGKTSCVDIAVWAMAKDALRPPARRMLPTRVWYVVNRRLLVDAAFEHGMKLASRLSRHEKPPGVSSDALSAVAEVLRERCGLGDVPLVITRLRGGAELGARPPHPAQPAVIFATVPMFASSWLFRGYASSRSMRPVDAAHAGIDSLVLLDEAHLSRPLRDLAEPVAQCDVGDPEQAVEGPRSRPLMVSLTATGDADHPFLLDAVDRAHPIVAERLAASKPVEIRGVPKKAADLALPLADAALDVLATRATPASVVIFANTPARARGNQSAGVRAERAIGPPLSARGGLERWCGW